MERLTLSTGETVFAAMPGEDRQVIVPTLQGGVTDEDVLQYGIDHMVALEDNPGAGKAAFVDYVGRHIVVPQREDDRKIVYDVPIAYAPALWELRHGNLLPGPDGTYWRRIPDPRPNPQLLDIWAPMANVEQAWGIAPRDYNPKMWPLMQAMLDRSRVRVIKGVKFHNCVYTRTGVDPGKTFGTIHSKFVRLPATDPLYKFPTVVTFTCDDDPKLAQSAVTWSQILCNDDQSAANWLRWFATPAAEPYKHLMGVWAGKGANGKGVTTSCLATHPATRQLYTPISVTKLFGSSGFAQDNATGVLADHLWAVDSEASQVTLQMQEMVKRTATGDMLYAREVQKNGFWFKPMSTLLICTNLDVIMSQDANGLRRQCCVRMADGIPQDVMDQYLEWLNGPGLEAIFMASCREWMRSDTPYRDIRMGDPDTLTDHEQWLVDQICTQGFAIGAQSPYYNPRSSTDQAAHNNAIAKLGLRSKRERINGKPERVLRVQTESRFAPYRERWERDMQDADAILSRTIAEPPSVPAPAPAGRLPSDYEFRCDYVAADAQKVAKNWKKQVTDPTVDTSRPPRGATVYAVVPQPGYVVLDLDIPHGDSDAPNGWELLNREVGDYGTSGFPSTFMVRTPSGGVHLYYRLPAGWTGRLKNSAHPRRPDMAAGIPVDLRVDGKGYVIGPGSKTMAGEYTLVQTPDPDMPVATLSAELLAWLGRNGYVEGQSPAWEDDRPRPAAAMGFRPDGPTKSVGAMRLDMSPVPEGSRNETLSKWVYGLLINHPDDARDIEDALMERGRASGLGRQELETIWRSAYGKAVGR